MFRTYSQDILDLFKSAVNGNRKAFKSLMTTEKHPELAAFSNALRGDEKAEMWIVARGGAELTLIMKAIDHDEIAFNQLQHRDDKFDISFVLACQNRVEGIHWLTVNEYSQFLPICRAIVETLHTKKKERAFWYKTFH